MKNSMSSSVRTMRAATLAIVIIAAVTVLGYVRLQNPFACPFT